MTDPGRDTHARRQRVPGHMGAFAGDLPSDPVEREAELRRRWRAQRGRAAARRTPALPDPEDLRRKLAQALAEIKRRQGHS